LREDLCGDKLHEQTSGISPTSVENTASHIQPIRFGAFELDLRTGELRKQGVKIKLQDQPFQILSMLLGRPGAVVTREELRNRLWPSDTFVDFDHSLNKAVNKLREALGDSAENSRFIETLAKRGYRFILNLQGGPGQIRSLLVLPLENLSRDPEREYFADGLTEQLTTKLARISALRVLSRTTAMLYKGARKPLPEIASELHVDGVVVGAVLRSGERVRISAQLIHAPSDTHLWAESYERDMRNVLALQSEVAQAIARGIQVKLTPQEEAHFAEVNIVDPEAYEAYLKGRFHWNRRNAEEFGKAVRCFQQAIAKDPTYAVAYAGLADSLSIIGFWGLVPPVEGSGRAKGLALKALEMDLGLAEAHVSLAWATMLYDYDFPAAEREFERAIELNPRLTQAHQWFGFYLALMGRYEESYTELKRAIRLDPCSSIVHWTFGFVYWRARRYDQAIEQQEKALELDFHSAQWHWGLGVACLDGEKYERAISALQRADVLSPGAPPILGYLGAAYASAGQLDSAQKILLHLNGLSGQQRVTPYYIGRIHAALGKKDEALHWLETAYQERDPFMLLLKTEAGFDDLRSAPRFQDLMRSMNFQQ
jgi:TolB-like protein/DNA-binding winged helix-turn-helix (wHTH) protein